MGNGKKAGIGLGIIIVLFVAYLGLNVYAISSLQFRNHQAGKFDFADMSMDTQLEACNPTFFPASFNKFNVDMIYKATDFGTFSVYGTTIPPHSSSIVDARLRVNAQAVLGFTFSALGSAITGKNTFDQNQVHLNANLDAPILDIIPFSINKSYSLDEFRGIISGQGGKFDC